MPWFSKKCPRVTCDITSYVIMLEIVIHLWQRSIYTPKIKSYKVCINRLIFVTAMYKGCDVSIYNNIMIYP